MFKKIPTYDDVKKEWGYTFFKTKDEFLEFLWSLFKEPGKYGGYTCMHVIDTSTWEFRHMKDDIFIDLHDMHERL